MAEKKEIRVPKKKGHYEGFKKLKGELAHKGAENPSALAAYIGRKKYGAEGMEKMAEAGKK